MKFNRPTLITLTAPTCSGKSTLLNALTDEREPHLTRIVSTTTRPPRPGERDGVDYHFISEKESLNLEFNDAFAELIEFWGVRYGVTKKEMEAKMSGELAPVVILEPKGLAMYEKLCREHGWDIYRVFVYTPEVTLLDRLNDRTIQEVRNAVEDVVDKFSHGEGVPADALTFAQKIITTHTNRILSITGEERAWRTKFDWDLLIPGDDLPKAIADLQMGINWRNTINSRTYN